MNDLKEYLYLLRPTRLAMLTEGPTEQEQTLVGQHFNYLKELTERGVVVLMGRTQNNDETTFGIVIFRAPSDEAAREIMNNDPAVRNNIMTATLYPYRIALMAKG
jgi:uncharacterized protein YciI